jgi:hypothetical protein
MLLTNNLAQRARTQTLGKGNVGGRHAYKDFDLNKVRV